VVVNNSWPSAGVLPANMLFLNQVVTESSYLGPAWSLSLEFWLYCLAPLLFTLPDRQLQRLMWGSFVCFVFFTCGRTLFHWNYYAGVSYGLNLVFLSFVWLAGFRLAKAPEKAMHTLREIGLMFAQHIALGAAILFVSRMKHGLLGDFLRSDAPSFVLQAVGLSLVWWVLHHFLKNKANSVAPMQWVRLLGDISYPLYLIHVPIFELLRYYSVPRSPLLYCGVAVVTAWLLYRGLDFYSQRRHRRGVVPAVSTPPTVPATLTARSGGE